MPKIRGSTSPGGTTGCSHGRKPAQARGIQQDICSPGGAKEGGPMADGPLPPLPGLVLFAATGPRARARGYLLSPRPGLHCRPRISGHAKPRSVIKRLNPGLDASRLRLRLFHDGTTTRAVSCGSRKACIRERLFGPSATAFAEASCGGRSARPGDSLCLTSRLSLGVSRLLAGESARRSTPSDGLQSAGGSSRLCSSGQ